MRDFHFEKLTKQAIATYTLERAALLNGDAEKLQAADDRKRQLLADLDRIEAQIVKSPRCDATLRSREELASLLSIVARRTSENEQLARANRKSGGGGWDAR